MTVAMLMGDTGEFGNVAPQPVDADSVERGSFSRLGEGQGVVSTSNGTHRPTSGASVARHAKSVEAKPIGKHVIAIIVVGAVAAIALAVFLFVRILNAGGARQGQTVVEQTVVSQEDAIAYRGFSYALAQKDGKYVLVETAESGSGKTVELGDLPGAPACLVLYDGALIIPENLSDGSWDVMAYTIGSGWSSLMSSDGSTVGGSGTIGSGALEGSDLVLQVDGQTMRVPLEW